MQVQDAFVTAAQEEAKRLAARSQALLIEKRHVDLRHERLTIFLKSYQNGKAPSEHLADHVQLNGNPVRKTLKTLTGKKQRVRHWSFKFENRIITMLQYVKDNVSGARVGRAFSVRSLMAGLHAHGDVAARAMKPDSLLVAVCNLVREDPKKRFERVGRGMYRITVAK